jgi:glycosyltransferase involved in cell wall biosynthesis
MPEIAGDAALLVDPYKSEEIVYAIKQILTDDKFRESLCKKGIERAAQFSWKHMAEKYLKLYLELSTVKG